jgi:F0F1-type ATP synthase membrane subunit b/b'
VVASTKKECAELEASTRAEVDAECVRIHERAESALATERQEMVLELREQLVEMVSSATRSIMNEKLTSAEQRALIEGGILGSMSASSNSDARVETLAAQPVQRGA